MMGYVFSSSFAVLYHPELFHILQQKPLMWMSVERTNSNGMSPGSQDSSPQSIAPSPSFINTMTLQEASHHKLPATGRNRVLVIKYFTGMKASPIHTDRKMME
jgi:hypothetical protein